MPRRRCLFVQARAEESLLTELESEWLNQFWVQGRRHAALHPWWRGPMALVLATWRELERRTAARVVHLLTIGARPPETATLGSSGAGGQRSPGLEPTEIARAFDTVLRALEERKEARSRWDARFVDPVYRSLPPDCSPVAPALWGDGPARDVAPWLAPGSDGRIAPLPKDLGGVVTRLRESYRAAYRAACGGRKADSAKAIASGGTSNWELLLASGSASHPGKDGGSSGPGEKRLRPGGVGGGGSGSGSSVGRSGKAFDGRKGGGSGGGGGALRGRGRGGGRKPRRRSPKGL